MNVTPPRVLELTCGSARTIRVTLLSNYEQGLPANTSGATSAVLSISDSLSSTPFFIKTGTVTNGIASFSPTQPEADAWLPGHYVAVVTVLYNTVADKTDSFQVVISKSLPHA